MLGILYHEKKVIHFNKAKKEKKWNQIPVNYTKNKKLMVIGYGDIGQAVGKMAMGLNLQVTGVRKNVAAGGPGRVISDYKEAI